LEKVSGSSNPSFSFVIFLKATGVPTGYKNNNHHKLKHKLFLFRKRGFWGPKEEGKNDTLTVGVSV
jgi:hypothetical protein